MKKIPATLSKIIFLFVLQFTSGMIKSQPPLTYKVNDTLVSGQVITTISQNTEYTWIGTTDGVIRRSVKTGKEKTFGASGSSQTFGFITSICCRKNGHVWIGTLNGILLYDGYYFFLMNTENTRLGDNLITFIFED